MITINHKLSIKISAIIIIAIFVSIIYAGYRYPISLVSIERDTIININPGTSFNEAINKISESGIIGNQFIFTIYAKVLFKITSKKLQIQSGEYLFKQGMNYSDVIYTIIHNRHYYHRLVIQEGKLSRDIVEIINQDDSLYGEAIDPNLIEEGSLFPSTYLYVLGESKKNIINMMQEKMNSTVDKIWEQRGENIQIKTKEEATILASIIEKETSIKEEKDKIASVFINRLKSNMPLQSDPTIIYAILMDEANGKPKAKYLKKKFTSYKSPYNSYKHKGLPPTAICNPGIESIEAAVNPQNTKLLYFVVNGNRGHIFAENIKEHKKNTKKYRNSQ